MLSDFAEKKETSLTLKNRENRIFAKGKLNAFNQKMPFFLYLQLIKTKKTRKNVW